jgi:hypothetical protein
MEDTHVAAPFWQTVTPKPPNVDTGLGLRVIQRPLRTTASFASGLRPV